MENRTDYKNQYNKDNYKTVKVYIRKDQYEQISEHWRSQGFKSLNSYINHLIAIDMQQSRADQTVNVQNNTGVIMRDNQGVINMSN